jgi:hypothetical protein
VYKPATTLVSLPKPTEGPAGSRIGTPPLRDRALLSWCTDLLEALDPVTAAASACGAITGQRAGRGAADACRRARGVPGERKPARSVSELAEVGLVPRDDGRQNRNPRRQDWGDKAERQYEAIEESQEERGASRGRAEEIAARTVNKQRARAGQTKQASKTSTEDISAPRRGGIRSGNGYGPGGRTKAQLYRDAQAAGIRGRSKMSKQELQACLARSG